MALNPLGFQINDFQERHAYEIINVFITIILILALIDAVINGIFLALRLKTSNRYAKMEPLPNNGRSSATNSLEDEPTGIKHNRVRDIDVIHPQEYKTIKMVIFGTECLMMFLLTLAWDFMVSYDLVPSNYFALFVKLIMLSVMYFVMVIRYNLLFISDTQKFYKRSLRKYPLFIFIGCIYSFFVMMLTVGMCTAFHNEHLPGFMLDHRHYSTAFSRYMAGPVCEVGAIPCMVYATLPEEALDGVFINFHINPESCVKNKCKPKLYYRQFADDICVGTNCNVKQLLSEGWTEIKPVKGEYQTPPHEYEERNVYTALIDGLRQQEYVFKIIDPSQKSHPTAFLYKNFNTKSMRIVAGGDVGNNDASVAMNQNTAAKLDADLFMIGGDIAYDNGFPYCYRTWDVLLNSIPIQREDSKTGLTRIIPTIYGPGNHDIGADTYKSIGNLRYPKSVFKHFLPQNTHFNEVPDIDHRRTYFANRFGSDLIIISLDTGYEVPVEGSQTLWLESELKMRDYKTKFVHYHNAIYPSFTDWDSVTEITKRGRKYWVPLFDQYNMTAAIENHNHFFKRTMKMKNQTEDENGTWYLGEGSWGLNRTQDPTYDTEFTVKAGNNQSLWIIDLNMSYTDLDYTNDDTSSNSSNDKLKIFIDYEARNENNVVLDKFNDTLVY